MNDADIPRPSWLRRAAAWVALLAAAAAIVYLGVEAIRRWYILLLSVLSLSALVVAAWYALSRRGSARWIAVGVAAVALTCFGLLVITSESLRVLVIGLALAALSVGAARVSQGAYLGSAA